MEFSLSAVITSMIRTHKSRVQDRMNTLLQIFCIFHYFCVNLLLYGLVRFSEKTATRLVRDYYELTSYDFVTTALK